MGKKAKWIAGAALLLLIVAPVASYLFVERELTKMYGGHTERAELSLPQAEAQPYAFVNVNVLTPDATHFEARAVVVVDGRISDVLAQADLPDGIKTIDGQGRFLVPGFTDSHVHTWQSENDLLLYVANGVTQVREMNGSEESLRWKREIANGRIGPDMFVVAPQLATFDGLEGRFVAWTQKKTIVPSQADVERVVREFAAQGYDAVKSSSYLSRDSYQALGRVAKRLNFPVLGHIPVAADLDDMFQVKPTEIAHVEELMKALDREFGGYDVENAEEFLDFVRSRSGDVAERLRNEGIAVTSTLALIDSFPRQKENLDRVLRAAPLEYANPGITEGTVITSRGMGWLPNVNIYRMPEEWDEARRRKSLAYWNAYAAATGIVFDALLDNGVTILAGTDANVPVMVPGFSLHEEFRTLNDAGMAPAQVLASATVAPGKWTGARVGQIRPGFVANLVMLRGNPLSDIAATGAIEMVVKQGRRFTRDDLDAMLAAVKSANDRSRSVKLPL
ncbi:amidohydrolase family protein [Novosphingobium sp. PC22D]|uniref:amidohydrolase family protein n=1 Tax=Novosphingobium sp. PC22D TaxID=1962403 RepID=UPI001145CF09|nr:amidohydrolase family protein [Novosphingobium sp. PC22D]